MKAIVGKFRRRATDGGFSLVELLVAMSIFVILSGVLLAATIGSNNSVKTTRQAHNLNEEARVTINRIARELRQAQRITQVVNPDGPSYDANNVTAVTFEADFNGNGTIDDVPDDPEVLTYCYKPGPDLLMIIPGPLTKPSPQCVNEPGAKPILGGNVSAFKLEYRSAGADSYLYDANADGITTWLELDGAASPIGDGNATLDQNELKLVDVMLVSVTVLEAPHQQTYRTQVNLRNQA
ncbi:MAG: prepilin-type N-terminal cleavage/methylation domain-containing protein [Frankia sp.]|nr:prepilin-type N-terminal cleavage/methylation domain-containing protein [Frankia sp.]